MLYNIGKKWMGKYMKKSRKILLIIITILFTLLASVCIYIFCNNKGNIEIEAGVMNEQNMSMVQSSDGKQVPVPTGYVASSVASENNVSKGFVIYQGTTPVTSANLKDARTNRSQWVWVPVDNVNDLYHTSGKYIYGNQFNFSGTSYSKVTNKSLEPASLEKESKYLATHVNNYTEYEFISQLRKEFLEMIQSVKTYGGFYIGRYETGNLSQDVPKTTKYNRDIGNQTWYQMYNKCKRFDSQNSSIKTSMIWGCQWDATLIWFVKTKKLNITSSTAYGNYQTADFYFYESASATTTTRKPAGTFRDIPTGSAEYTAVNNVYDMAGNLWDCTLEINGETNIVHARGAYHYDNGNSLPISIRGGVPNNQTFGHVGCRAMLYIL